MHTLAFLAAFLFLTLHLPAQDLDTYRWKNRLVLVFAPDALHPDRVSQHDLFQNHTAGLADRDVKVLWLSPKTNAALYTRYGIGQEEFAVILIGKDGGEKHRWGRPVSAEIVYGLIDAMPMRQAEVNRQKP